MASNWAQLVIRQCCPVHTKGEASVGGAPWGLHFSRAVGAGGCCAFTSPCSLQGSVEKVRPSFIFLFSLHNGFLWEGLVRQSRRGGEEFRGSSSQPLLSVDGDMWLLQLYMEAHTAVCTAGARWLMRRALFHRNKAQLVGNSGQNGFTFRG